MGCVGRAWGVRVGRAWGAWGRAWGVLVRRGGGGVRGTFVGQREGITRSALLSGYLGKSGHLPRCNILSSLCKVCTTKLCLHLLVGVCHKYRSIRLKEQSLPLSLQCHI